MGEGGWGRKTKFVEKKLENSKTRGLENSKLETRNSKLETRNSERLPPPVFFRKYGI